MISNDETNRDGPISLSSIRTRFIAPLAPHSSSDKLVASKQLLPARPSKTSQDPIQLAPSHLTVMVVISRFRSLWGIEPGPDQSEWRKKFVELKAHGYGKLGHALEYR